MGIGTLYTLFLLSGAAGLIYEILWVRLLTTVFGSTTFAVSAVLSAFMAGLALGSYVLGRCIDTSRHSPLRVYALLEGGIGLYALLFPFLLEILQRLYRLAGTYFLSALFLGALSKFLAAFVLLLLPTALMGGTLPVLSRLVARDPTHLGRRVGLLYALNTFGAVVGSFCAGFLLLPALGFSRTNLLAVSLNLAIAGVAWLREYLARGVPAAPSPRHSAAENQPQTGDSLLLLACALAGFAALGYEVLWTRALILILGTTTYSFTTVLVTFLTGLALGSFLCSFLVDHCRDLRKLFAWIQVSIGGTVLLFTAAFGTFPFLFLKLYTIFGASAGQLTVLKFLLAFLAMLLPTLLMGGVFPVISKLYTRDPQRVGHGIGTVYAANTVGAILGAFTTGFVLLPWLGIKQSLLCLIYLNCGLALMIFVPPWPRHWRSLVGRLGPVLVIVVAVRIFLPSWNPALLDIGVYYGPEAYLEARLGVPLASRVHKQRLLHAQEGLNATVAVFQNLEGERTLRINGKPVSSTIYDDMRLQRMIGHLPLLLHAHPQRVLVIGLGTGITLGAVARHAVEAIEVVEIEASVREAVSYFSRENHDVLAQPNVTLIIDDGRNYLEVTPQRYEVITSDPIHPWVAGAASLYTREYYQIAKRRLAPGGFMAQWVPLYELSPDDYRMVVKTFAQVFPFVSLWFTGTDTLLIGSAQPWAIDVSRLREQLKIPAIREDLEIVHLHDPYILLSHFLFSETAIPSLVQGAQLNTDDYPRLEYTAPQSLYRPTMPENLMALLRYREPLLPRLRQIPPPERSTIATTLARYAEAKLRAQWGQIHRWQGQDKQSIAAFEAALQINPADGDTRRKLASLYAEVGGTWQRRGDLEQATRLYQQALQIDPDLAQARGVLGGIHEAQGRIDEAIAAYRRVLRTNPDALRAHGSLAALYRQRGKLEPALTAYQHVVRLAPEQLTAWYALADLSQQLGQLDRAKAAYQTIIQRDPGAAAAYGALGTMALLEGRLAEAQAAFQKVLKLRGAQDKAYAALGVLYQKRQEWDKAVDAYEKAIQENPEYTDALTNLAWLYVERGIELEKAHAYAQRVEALEASHLAKYILARIAFQRQQYTEAEARIREALRLAPDSVLYHEQLQAIQAAQRPK